METFELKVIACDRVFYEGRCQQVIFPLQDGEKAVQAHHENMVLAVYVGEIRIQDEASGKSLYDLCMDGRDPAAAACDRNSLFCRSFWNQ